MQPEDDEPDAATWRAEQARVRREQRLERAVLIVAGLKGLDEQAALADLRSTAARAGVSVDEIARTVLLFHED